MMVVEQIIGWIVGISLIVFIPYTIYFNIVHFSSKFKCRKKHYDEYFNRCHEDDCKWSKFCENYYKPLSEEEVAKLHKMIDELKKAH